MVCHGTLLSQALSVRTLANLNKLLLPDGGDPHPRQQQRAREDAPPASQLIACSVCPSDPATRGKVTKGSQCISQRARLNVQSKAGTLAPPVPALPWGGSARSCDQRPVTSCLLPPLLLALSIIQLFDQLVIALPHVRGLGHPLSPLFSLY